MEGSVRIGVLQHIFIYLAPTGETKIGGGGGGGKSICFWKGLFTGSPKIPKSEPYELQEKSFCGTRLKFDMTYQPQAEMLLLLDLWDLRQYQNHRIKSYRHTFDIHSL